MPIPNKLISISTNEANNFFNATTNEQGLAQFSINTTNIPGNQLFLTVSMKGKKLEDKEALVTVMHSKVKKDTD